MSFPFLPVYLRLVVILILGSALWPSVEAYIPAMPTNDSVMTMDSSNASTLYLRWFGGEFNEQVSYQLVGADSNGINEVCTVSSPAHQAF